MHALSSTFNNKRNGCTCSPSNKEGEPSKASSKQAGHAAITLIGFSHPHPRIQTLWTPQPRPESKVISRSLTTHWSTKKTRNPHSNHKKGFTEHSKNNKEEETYQR
jgi:hypothetical protein